MAHLLLLEAPGGNDFDLLDAAVADGHAVSFFTADVAHYAANGTLSTHLARARRIVEVAPFTMDALEGEALRVHGSDPFDALLCLVDIRIVEAARLAEKLGLRFLNSRSAATLRDKYAVRRTLERHGLAQPPFALARTNAELRAAVTTLGLPVVVKPCDGYGSQNISMFLTEDDLNPLIDPLDHYLPCPADYGLGVQANGRLLVERHLAGQLIGCDTFTRDGRHVMLGINEKWMFPHPSCAIAGGCFPSDRFDAARIRAYLFAVLDALGFDQGVAHTEILVTPDGPQLVEVNPRLVGARIPRLLSAALERPIHRDVIDLHLGKAVPDVLGMAAPKVAVSKWIISERHGTLSGVVLPGWQHGDVRHVEVLRRRGDSVCYPHQNADRIGYVMTVGENRAEAEALAERFLDDVRVVLEGDEKADCTVDHLAGCDLPTPWATFRLHAFLERTTGKEHLALVLGDTGDPSPMLARIHSECLTGDTLFSLRCDCGAQLESALRSIAAAGRGVLLYLRQEGRGIGLVNKIRAYALQEGGADTVEANHALGFAGDLRDYGVCRPILHHFGVRSVVLMTNNPAKVEALTAMGFTVARTGLIPAGTSFNARYLATKAEKLGHLLGPARAPGGGAGASHPIMEGAPAAGG